VEDERQGQRRRPRQAAITGSTVAPSQGDTATTATASTAQSTSARPNRTGSGTWELTAADDADWPVSFSFHKISGYWDSEHSVENKQLLWSARSVPMTRNPPAASFTPTGFFASRETAHYSKEQP
jgi:hypothetical protein